MFLRRTFAVLLLSTLAMAPCLGVCTGWAASPDARMACCIGKAADEAKMCCAAGESRQNADSSAPLPVGLPPVEPIVLKIATTLAPQLRSASATDSHDPVIDDSARYVLLSVFLI